MSSAYTYITVSSRDGIAIFQMIPPDIIEFEIAQPVGEEMGRAFEACGATHAIVDLQDLRMMSSVAYGPFVDLLTKVSQANGRVFLCHMSDVIKDVFTATRLLAGPRSTKSRFEAADSVEDAVQQILGSG